MHYVAIYVGVFFYLGVALVVKVLLSGARGFIGSHLREHFAAQGKEVITYDRAQDNLADMQSCDVVIHAAARAHILREEEADPRAAFYAANVELTQRLADAAQQYNVPRFIYLSSAGVHGNVARTPLVPDSPIAPHSFYVESKFLGEEIVRAGAEHYTIIRLPLVYGPRVGANFLRLMRMIKIGALLPLASIHNKRDFCAVQNLCNFVQHCAQDNRAVKQTFLLCDGEPVSTADLVRSLAHYIGVNARLFPCPESVLRAAAN